MENVVAFNNELSGLYDTKPPISKAKMAAITKAAMRAIKFYKHVVQSVEKFILKCKPEYKVPGLYVIDSIVRQSRHQYGPEKDVFAPRFARNMQETFANLFRCAPEDKSRIIRVLNLWQKNMVFAPEVIQPIFDLADPNHPIYQMPPVGLQAGPAVSADQLSNTANGVSVPIDNSMNASSSSMNMSLSEDKNNAALPDLSNNNLKQLLNDPNVLRQLQTLQNFTKFKQQEENKHHKLSEMRMQEEAAYEKHLHNALKSSGVGQTQESNEYNADVEFVSMEQNIEVINLDGNDSRSPSPERERYKRRRSRSNSKGRDRRGSSRERRRRSRSRSKDRSRSPRSNRRRSSRDRERSSRDVRESRDNREKERDREHERERRKKGLPELKKEHLSVCSTTLWVGHLSKLVYQEELSDTFGEFGDIVSIDQIVPRGCAFIVMHRRQDAYKAMHNLKNHKLQGRAITISWAAGKGVKSKEWKDYWDLELGVTYIPWNKLDENTDFDSMEEGGMFDEDSMPNWMKEKIQRTKSQRANNMDPNQTANVPSGSNLIFGIDTTQPPPPAPPSLMSMTLPGQFPMAPPMSTPPRPLLGPLHGMSIQGISMPPNLMPSMPPPPHAMMMPPGMMPPGFPMQHATPMAMPPPNAAQFPPPPATAAMPTAAGSTPANNSSDDQMDIEIDEDETTNTLSPAPATQLNFNQPPPLFNNNNNNNMNANSDANGTAMEIFTRDRNRPSSRWGGGNRGADDDNEIDGNDRWREYNDNRGGGNHAQRPDFMNENRGGRGPRGADFFPNMPPNRFNQPTSLLQMRIPPPQNMFNPRMGPGPNGGGPMFMRGGPQGGGGRQQGPGGFFNPRNPFSDGGRGGGGGRSGRQMDGRGNRGGGRNSYGANNWSDEEGDDVGFKRRGGGNRFRDEPRGSRRGGGGGGGDWGHQRERRDYGGNRRNSRNQDAEKHKERNSPAANETIGQNTTCDTEDDWDRELEDYDARMEQSETLNNNKNNVFERNEQTHRENDQTDEIAATNTYEITNNGSFVEEFPKTNSTNTQEISENHQQDIEAGADTQPTDAIQEKIVQDAVETPAVPELCAEAEVAQE